MMHKKILLKTLIVMAVLALGLTSCNLLGYFENNDAEDFNQIETMAAATISARFTQAAFDALAGQLTQMAPTAAPPTPQAPLASSTPIPTNTPIATFTPLATSVPPTATAIPIPCNAAKYIDDITIPDWSTLYAGEEFVKTWQVKNVGTCSWTKDYHIYFADGKKLDAPTSLAFPKTVNPGETVNLSVPMVAPSDKGSYTGSWLLEAANGVKFGVGYDYSVPLTVNIKVENLPEAKDPDTRYDLVKEMCSASWRTNAGDIGCPSARIDTDKGSITRSYAPVIAGGYKDDEGALYTVPAKGGDGMILGKFPRFKFKSGDRFRSLLVCADKAKKCSVTYELLYNVSGSDEGGSLGSWDVSYSDSEQVDVNLNSLAGKEAYLLLKVYSKGDPTDDVALWMAARVTNP